MQSTAQLVRRRKRFERGPLPRFHLTERDVELIRQVAQHRIRTRISPDPGEGVGLSTA